MKKAFLLILALLTVLSAVACGTSEDERTPSLFFPKPAEPDHLYVIHRDGLSNHEKIMLSSMQGITAKDKACIYIGGNENYTLWLEDLKETRNVPTEEINDVYELLEKVSDSIKGYILYDLTDGTSLNVATSLAGINRAIMVDQHIEEKIKEMGFELIMDVRGLDDQWLFDNYADKFGQGEDLLNDELILEQRALENDERYFLLRDYAIFCNMATIYQGVTPLKTAFLEKLKDNSIIIGWGDGDKFGESELGTIAAQNGVMQVASDWMANLSTFAAFDPIEKVIPQKTETDPETVVAEDYHYVTFIWTDGDNIQWTTGDFAMNTKYWASESRGKYNMGWGINNLLYEAAPNTLEYYYKTASNTENAKDYFVVGPHYAYATEFRDTLPQWTEDLNTLMGKTGLKYVQINELNTLALFREAFDDYTEHENIHGIFYLEYDKYHKHRGRILWSNGKPVVTAKYAIWDPNSMPTANPENVLKLLNSSKVDPTSQAGYSFVTIHAWSGYTMDDICEMISNLEPHVKVVTPDEFMQLISQNVEHDQ